jgi:D-tyrosyl-tRNA(Tyr) deacylase
LVVQRVTRASVTVDGEVTGAIGEGLLVLVGIEPGDGAGEIDRAADKVIGMRIFPDDRGLMNRSVVETGGSALVVSQFTLLGDLRRGRRPSFTGAALPELARPLVEGFVERMRASGVRTESGVFGALMDVELVNHGPVTVVFDVRDGRVR